VRRFNVKSIRLNLKLFNAELDTNASYTSKAFLLASKAVIELELSTTIAKLGLMISKSISSNYGINQQQDDPKQR
jgi:hypothetical protein